MNKVFAKPLLPRLQRRWRTLSDPRQLKNKILKLLPGVLRVNNRSVSKRVSFRGCKQFKKEFVPGEVGKQCFENEITARAIFHDRPWMLPLISHGERWLITPYLSADKRLDRVATGLDAETRTKIAKQALWVLFEMFSEGYAHRDFQAHNLFYVDDTLVVTDFETMAKYPSNSRPAFPLSYDLTGRGLPSPLATGSMSYTAIEPAERVLNKVLDVPFERAIGAMQEDLVSLVREACLSFKTEKGRHTCRAGRIYCSFSLPHFSVLAGETQRNAARRLANFGCDAAAISGKRVLDLGSNIGAMLFEIFKFGPSRCTGVEYDAEKVKVARTIAMFNGLDNYEFREGDVDRLRAQDFPGCFDTVFCLALEGHVRRKSDLYRLLGEVTAETLFFEGNASADVDDVKSQLLAAGFSEVISLGLCDDDCLADNNCRPLLKAFKPRQLRRAF